MEPQYKEELVKFLDKIKSRAAHYIGYPAGVDYDYRELYAFLDYNLNNVGDPFMESYDMHSKHFEREVIQFFAELFHAPKDNWWGYVTNGGSEGNLYALYLARELYANGMVYYSEATHYSVQKNIHLLGMKSIVVRSQESGEIDYDDLKEMIQMNRHLPVIILANIGATMTEAKDDVTRIRKILKQYAIKSFYIHSDAALSGVYLGALNEGHFNFEAGADSIAVSGHKFIGSPIPCGVVVVKKSYKNRIGRSIPYIGSLDTTISGSRNGITPLFLWYALNKMGTEGLKRRAIDCLSLAAYAEKALQHIGIKAWRNPHALTVVFPKPNPAICNKWQLATENDLAHLICMPGITKDQIDRFIADLQSAQNGLLATLTRNSTP
jgi:histidine decarboxylase